MPQRSTGSQWGHVYIYVYTFCSIYTGHRHCVAIRRPALCSAAIQFIQDRAETMKYGAPYRIWPKLSGKVDCIHALHTTADRATLHLCQKTHIKI